MTISLSGRSTNTSTATKLRIALRKSERDARGARASTPAAKARAADSQDVVLGSGDSKA